VDLEDLAPLRERGEVDEEDLVEAPLAQELGRELLDPFAVATTNTGAVFSCSQVRSVPITRAVTPPSETPDDCIPASPFSISSIQSTTGATLSATWMARRRFSSEEPTSPLKIRPMSSRSRGSPHCAAMAFAVRLFAAALDAEEEEPLRLGEAELPGRLGEGRAAPREPGLERVEAADVLEPLLRRVVLEQPALADHLPLLVEHERHVVLREPAVVAIRLRETRSRPPRA